MINIAIPVTADQIAKDKSSDPSMINHFSTNILSLSFEVQFEVTFQIIIDAFFYKLNQN